MKRVILSCNPAGGGRVECSKQIKSDMNENTKPDIVYYFKKGIPMKNDSADISVASEILDHIYSSNLPGLFLKILGCCCC